MGAEELQELHEHAEHAKHNPDAAPVSLTMAVLSSLGGHDHPARPSRPY